VKRLALALLLAFAGCGRSEQPVDTFPKGCVIASVEYQANLSLRRHGVWSRIVKVNFDNQADGHAIVVFSLNKGGDLVVYDVNRGTRALLTSDRNLPAIRAALRYHYNNMTTAVWFD
jgi:hypothetical protein